MSQSQSQLLIGLVTWKEMIATLGAKIIWLLSKLTAAGKHGSSKKTSQKLKPIVPFTKLQGSKTCQQKTKVA